MEFPHVDLPVDLIAWTDVTEDILNIYKQSCRLKACIFALCTEGSITVSINLMDTEIKQGDFIILLPGTIIQFHGQKEKVRICFAGFSEHCLNGVNIIQSTMSSYSKIIEAPVIPLNETVASYFRDYFALLARISTGRTCPRREWRRTCWTPCFMVSTSYTAAVPTPKTGLKAGKRKSAVSSYNWSSKTTPPNAARSSMPRNWAYRCNTSAPPSSR